MDNKSCPYFLQFGFECLKSGYNQELKVQNDYITPDNDYVIETKDHIKDLGIWMSETGDFSYHISKVISKVKQRIGWISRSFRTNDIEFKKLAIEAENKYDVFRTTRERVYENEWEEAPSFFNKENQPRNQKNQKKEPDRSKYEEE